MATSHPNVGELPELWELAERDPATYVAVLRDLGYLYPFPLPPPLEVLGLKQPRVIMRVTFANALLTEDMATMITEDGFMILIGEVT